MQTTIINEVHIKVSHNEETRRFLLEKVSYDKLVDLLKTLFSINPASTLDLKYQDDEQDWVILGSDEDLMYAASLSKTVRLVFNVTQNIVDQTENVPEVVPMTVSAPEELSTPKPDSSFGGKWRGNGRCGGRGKGRGRGMGRRNCDVPPMHPSDRIPFKISKLEEKIASGSYPEEKIKFFKARLEKLREKQSALSLPNENLVVPFAEKLASKIAILEEKLNTVDIPEGRRNAIRNNIERLKAKQQLITSEVPSEGFKWKGNPEKIQHRIQMIREKLESGSVEGQKKQILENRIVKLEEKLRN